MNLFSVFDPTSYFNISLNWVIILLMFIMFPMKYYLLRSGVQNNILNFSFQVNKMFNEVAGSSKLALVFVCVVTFMYLIISNLLGLFPFIFTSTAHPMITMGVGLVFWMTFFLMGWVKNFKISAAHLVPEGSPIYLSPLMVVIESISHLMRPFTLSIRLAANMMAGHLIISLLSSISLMSFLGFSCSIILQSLLLILEFGVSVIQGFVFSILMLLYALEYY
uniref:ATP synthase subunit a n=1 Tax=Cyrtarachne nagasakiensis TaxID=386110 RepID=A0A0U2KXS4_9ARAC|nr:ATP synthase F0 subunit 6 [Cyrtarachne nagasakiensis]ALF36378.1 ATP synthase F0 subunit 6 [Cyrtarachne nagasakiensis]